MVDATLINFIKYGEWQFLTKNGVFVCYLNNDEYVLDILIMILSGILIGFIHFVKFFMIDTYDMYKNGKEG